MAMKWMANGKRRSQQGKLKRKRPRTPQLNLGNEANVAHGLSIPICPTEDIFSSATRPNVSFPRNNNLGISRDIRNLRRYACAASSRSSGQDGGETCDKDSHPLTYFNSKFSSSNQNPPPVNQGNKRQSFGLDETSALSRAPQTHQASRFWSPLRDSMTDCVHTHQLHTADPLVASSARQRSSVKVDPIMPAVARGYPEFQFDSEQRQNIDDGGNNSLSRESLALRGDIHHFDPPPNQFKTLPSFFKPRDDVTNTQCEPTAGLASVAIVPSCTKQSSFFLPSGSSEHEGSGRELESHMNPFHNECQGAPEHGNSLLPFTPSYATPPESSLGSSHPLPPPPEFWQQQKRGIGSNCQGSGHSSPVGDFVQRHPAAPFSLSPPRLQPPPLEHLERSASFAPPPSPPLVSQVRWRQSSQLGSSSSNVAHNQDSRQQPHVDGADTSLQHGGALNLVDSPEKHTTPKQAKTRVPQERVQQVLSAMSSSTFEPPRTNISFSSSSPLKSPRLSRYPGHREVLEMSQSNVAETTLERQDLDEDKLIGNAFSSWDLFSKSESARSSSALLNGNPHSSRDLKDEHALRISLLVQEPRKNGYGDEGGREHREHDGDNWENVAALDNVHKGFDTIGSGWSSGDGVVESEVEETSGPEFPRDMVDCEEACKNRKNGPNGGDVTSESTRASTSAPQVSNTQLNLDLLSKTVILPSSTTATAVSSTTTSPLGATSSSPPSTDLEKGLAVDQVHFPVIAPAPSIREGVESGPSASLLVTISSNEIGMRKENTSPKGHAKEKLNVCSTQDDPKQTSLCKMIPPNGSLFMVPNLTEARRRLKAAMSGDSMYNKTDSEPATMVANKETSSSVGLSPSQSSSANPPSEESPKISTKESVESIAVSSHSTTSMAEELTTASSMEFVADLPSPEVCITPQKIAVIVSKSEHSNVRMAVTDGSDQALVGRETKSMARCEPQAGTIKNNLKSDGQSAAQKANINQCRKPENGGCEIGTKRICQGSYRCARSENIGDELEREPRKFSMDQRALQDALSTTAWLSVINTCLRQHIEQ